MKRVFVGVVPPLIRIIPETSTLRSRNVCSNQSPAESSPIAVIGTTRAPRAAKLFVALAAPPGRMRVSRWRKISTGASLETRVISPYWNESATKSPRTTMRLPWKRSTISPNASKSAALDCTTCCGFRFILVGSESNLRHAPNYRQSRQVVAATPPNATFLRPRRNRFEQRPPCSQRGRPIPYHRIGHLQRRIAAHRYGALEQPV